MKSARVSSLDELSARCRTLADQAGLPWALFPSFDGRIREAAESVVKDGARFRYLTADAQHPPTELWSGEDAEELIYRIVADVCLTEAAIWPPPPELSDYDSFVAVYGRQLERFSRLPIEMATRHWAELRDAWTESAYSDHAFPFESPCTKT